MKNVAIIDASINHGPLHAKILRDVHDRPMLDQVIRRVARCQFVNDVVVVVPKNPKEDALIRHCKNQRHSFMFSQQSDALGRCVDAAIETRADRVVSISASAPLIDPGVIDQVIIKLENDAFIDLSSNCTPELRYPRGLEANAMTIKTLLLFDKLIACPQARNQMAFPTEEFSGLFNVCSVQPKGDYSHFNWHVDTESDLQLVNAIYRHFQPRRFRWRHVIDAYAAQPEWSRPRPEHTSSQQTISTPNAMPQPMLSTRKAA